MVEDRDVFEQGRPRLRTGRTGAQMDPRLLEQSGPRLDAGLGPAVPFLIHRYGHVVEGKAGWGRCDGVWTSAALPAV